MFLLRLKLAVVNHYPTNLQTHYFGIFLNIMNIAKSSRKVKYVVVRSLQCTMFDKP